MNARAASLAISSCQKSDEGRQPLPCPLAIHSITTHGASIVWASADLGLPKLKENLQGAASALDLCWSRPGKDVQFDPDFQGATAHGYLTRCKGTIMIGDAKQMDAATSRTAKTYKAWQFACCSCGVADDRQDFRSSCDRWVNEACDRWVNEAKRVVHTSFFL